MSDRRTRRAVAAALAGAAVVCASAPAAVGAAVEPIRATVTPASEEP